MEQLNTTSLFSVPELTELRRKPELFVVPPDYVPEVLPPTGEPLDIKVHKEHAYGVITHLLDAYENDQPPYNQDRVRLPHDPRHMPRTLERGTKEHAMFFFNVCYYMRGGIKTNEAVKRMSQVYDQWPELFDCEVVQDFEPKVLGEILGSNGLGFQDTVSGQWVENARRMSEKYDGDPRTIFANVTTYEQSQERIQNTGKNRGFLGFQEKMTSMIIYYLMDENLIEPFNFPIPVDLHVMRVSIANEFLTFNNAPNGTNLFTKETLASLRQLYFEYADAHGVKPCRLADAVWMLSESSCGKHPGNTTLEPGGRNNRNGRSTYLVPRTVDVRDAKQQQAYAASCGICPIEPTCKHNIPGTQYYVGGNIIIRGERARFPLGAMLQQTAHQETLFG